MKEIKKINVSGYSFIINKDELYKIYDELVKIRDMASDEQENISKKLYNTIWKLDEWYAGLLEDCGLVSIDRG